jgi:hypothetical protein
MTITNKEKLGVDKSLLVRSNGLVSTINITRTKFDSRGSNAWLFEFLAVSIHDFIRLSRSQLAIVLVLSSFALFFLFLFWEVI